MLTGCQISQKGFDFRPAQVVGATFVVEKDETFDPLDITFLGAPGVMPQANGVAHLVEQFLGEMG